MGGLLYIPQRVASAARHRIMNVSEAERPEVITAAITDLEERVNYELRRMASTINANGGDRSRPTEIDADYNVSSVDGTIFADTTSAGLTATLPPGSQYPGMTVCFKRQAGANTFTVAPSGSDTIEGGGSISVTTPVWYQSVVVSTGVADWRLVG